MLIEHDDWASFLDYNRNWFLEKENNLKVQTGKLAILVQGTRLWKQFWINSRKWKYYHCIREPQATTSISLSERTRKTFYSLKNARHKSKRNENFIPTKVITHTYIGTDGSRELVENWNQINFPILSKLLFELSTNKKGIELIHCP